MGMLIRIQAQMIKRDLKAKIYAVIYAPQEQTLRTKFIKWRRNNISESDKCRAS